MSVCRVVFAIVLLGLCLAVHTARCDGNGYFIKQFWYERGIENGNPKYNNRIRVNSPDTSLSQFKDRKEARANGMILIKMEEDLAFLDRAELYLELWGGHPGTAAKRVTANGRSAYFIPEVGAAGKNCTYNYPSIPLKVTDLVNGYNAFQFACDKGTTFWGHFLIDNACLRAVLKSDSPFLNETGLENFQARIETRSQGETIQTSLKVPSEFQSKIERVDFQGYYSGYDENGNRLTVDWHGFTKNREPVAWIGSSSKAPYETGWDVSMIPGQDDMAVRAFVRFKETNLVYVTQPLESIKTPERSESVTVCYSNDIPRPFASRVNRLKECGIELNVDPARIERAELRVVIWDGGKGDVEEPFKLNGHALPVAGSGAHDVLYRIVPIDPAILKKGANEIELLSDTEHHGIEILLPGPALIVRQR